MTQQASQRLCVVELHNGRYKILPSPPPAGAKVVQQWTVRAASPLPPPDRELTAGEVLEVYDYLAAREGPA